MIFVLEGIINLISAKVFASVCVFVCVCLCLWVSVYMCMCVCACTRARVCVCVNEIEYKFHYLHNYFVNSDYCLSIYFFLCFQSLVQYKVDCLFFVENFSVSKIWLTNTREEES